MDHIADLILNYDPENPQPRFKADAPDFAALSASRSSSGSASVARRKRPATRAVGSRSVRHRRLWPALPAGIAWTPSS